MTRFSLSLILVGILISACSAAASPVSTPTATPSASLATATVAPSTSAPPTSAPSPTPEAVTAAASFDGKACTYAGPTDLPRGSQVMFSFVNTKEAKAGGSIGGGLAVAAVVDGTTWEQVVKDATTHPATEAPSFALEPLDVSYIYPAQTDLGETLTVTMHANLYVVYAATSPDQTNKAFPCMLLKVHDR